MTMTTRNVVRLAAVFFAAVGLYCIYIGSTHKYYDLLGPGPGFFPIWIGALLAILSAALLLQSFRPSIDGEARPGAELPAVVGDETANRGPDAPFFPSVAAAGRIGGIVLALMAVWFLLDIFGFRLTIFVFAFLAPRIIERQPLLRSGIIALICGFGVAYAFENWLGVQLPKSSIEILRDLGL